MAVHNVKILVETYYYASVAHSADLKASNDSDTPNIRMLLEIGFDDEVDEETGCGPNCTADDSLRPTYCA
jgi:hypothetical protein